MMTSSTLMFFGGDGIVDTNSPGFEAEAVSGGGWWSPQALAVGFMLHKDQKYELSFDYSTTGDASVNYRIQQNHDSYAAFFRDSVKAGTLTQTAHKEFTAPLNDTNCALVLEFVGSGTVKIENLSLKAVKNETVPGDINCDGSLTASDFVILVKWLLGTGTVSDISAADMDNNQNVNILDLCLMKNAILTN